MAAPASSRATASPRHGLRRTTTLLDLVAAVASEARSDDEVVETVRHLINSGRVRLVGNFRGADVRVG